MVNQMGNNAENWMENKRETQIGNKAENQKKNKTKNQMGNKAKNQIGNRTEIQIKDKVGSQINKAGNHMEERNKNQAGEKIHLWIKAWKERIQEPGRYFPPGYPYEAEGIATGVLLGMGMILSLRFLVTLYREQERLQYLLDVDSARVWPETVAKSFLELLQGHFALYVPLLLFLLGMVVSHYFYYYHETRSIYVMRRLPQKDILWRSCIMGPLLGGLVGAVVLVLLYLLYFGTYLLVIPAECQPRFM